jgi:hypothetical protein
MSAWPLGHLLGIQIFVSRLGAANLASYLRGLAEGLLAPRRRLRTATVGHRAPFL